VASAASTAAPTAPFKLTDLGQVADQSGDPTAIQLPDGRVRLYVQWTPESGNHGEHSLISADGIQFSDEPGTRLDQSQAGPHERIFGLPGGGYRMYFNSQASSGAAAIGSAVSADGLGFAVEPGVRIPADAVAPKPYLSTGDAVPIGHGRYRMYFSSEGPDKNPDTGTPEFIRSAVSSDLLSWTVEPGYRIGPGAPTLTGSAEHPSAVRNPDGSVTLFYGRYLPPDFGLFTATSADGIHFRSEYRLISHLVLDAAALRLADGTLLLYYGDRDNVSGRSYVNVARLTPAPVALHVVVKGRGRVTGGGISCRRGTCTRAVPAAKPATLHAKAARHYRFAGWSRGCRGRAACTVAPSLPVTVVATFRRRH
jgi:hypothetical protein